MCAALCVALTAALPQATKPSHARGARRPNILVIVTDDQRADGTLNVMPQTRYWFKRKGTTFTNAHATTPWCCPSRASIFSGQYVHNHGVFDNSLAGALDQRSTFQRYFQRSGYNTGIAGKFLNLWNLDRDPPFWDRWAISAGGYVDFEVNEDGVGKLIDTYSTRYFSDRAIEYLTSFDERDRRPWLLYVAPFAPHSPFDPEPIYESAPVPPWSGNPAVFEKSRRDKPAFPRREITIEQALAMREAQLRTLMSVDDMVGDIFRRLVALNERRRTLAIFVSDNGYLWGEHSLYGKLTPYTQSTRIPLLMRWPAGGVGRGLADSRLTANIDIAPTILEAAKIEPDPEYPLDGRSLRAPGSRNRLLLEFFGNPEAMVPAWGSLRTPSSQYTEYDFEEGAFLEYYNLREDPWQLRNLLGDRSLENDPEVGDISRRLARDRTCVGSTCP
jgi:arylsulfatase A-like enzyme